MTVAPAAGAPMPLPFVSDHVETLYEVDMLCEEDAHAADILAYRRPEALYTHPTFIESLARLVEAHVGADTPAGRS